MPPLPDPDDALAIEDEAARAEVERLRTMHVLSLAVVIMPAIGGDGRGGVRVVGLSREEIARWLLRDYPRGARFHPLLRSAVRDAGAFLVKTRLAEQSGSAFVAGPDGVVSAPESLRPTAYGARLLAGDRLDEWAAYQARKAARIAIGDRDEPWEADFGWRIGEDADLSLGDLGTD